ncbi:Uncharacterised protein [Legionella birminghamensis]|uniref:Uncharacterized protein n=1 Tax=Legionella birminghamensis TaxID=28083 RepID=A0A378I9Z0_9GAMM|nr:Uncharacterised protein [Legionella birminghamensis]
MRVIDCKEQASIASTYGRCGETNSKPAVCRNQQFSSDPSTQTLAAET